MGGIAVKLGYARVSTDEQSDNAQLDALNNAGCARIFSEKFSGKSKQRPELERLIDSLLTPSEFVQLSKHICALAPT